jgi:hypothetical protein
LKNAFYTFLARRKLELCEALETAAARNESGA